MKPLILTGDRVRIKKTNYLKLKLNDILVIYLKNKIVAHRLIYKTPNFYITKGDNNIKSDGKIFSKQLIGRVHQLNRKHNKIELDNLYLFQSSIYFQEIVKINKLVEKETLYPLLPASLQEQFSLQDLVDKYAVSREAFQLALSEKHDVLVGCYNSGKDRCYVLRHCRHPDVIYGDKERTTIAVHELTHRWLHYQWQNLPSLQGKLWVADANDEESLCDDVEVFFSGTTFGNYGDSEIKIFSERIAEGVANATNPQRIFLFTKSRIKYYGRLLRE